MADFSKVKVGDRIRVTFEDTVEAVLPNGTIHTTDWCIDGSETLTSLELVEDIRTHDVVIDGNGKAYCRLRDGTWRDFNGYEYQNRYPARPLTLLARDGKAVQR